MRGIALFAMVAGLCFSQDRRVEPVSVARKQALIIGNSRYIRGPLKNPANDAVTMEAALKKLGFEVRTVRDLDQQHMESAIDEFTAGLSSGSLGLFYFSGHGVQVNSVNYLLPVDFTASSEADVKYKAYPATRVQEKMEESGARLRVMVLDACRNNPFKFKRDAAGGLAQMPVNAEGTLIAFATGDNNTADDNAAEGNGLYTKYLVPALLTPGLQLREAFQKAKEDVYRASRKEQNPSIYENVVGEYYLVAPPTGTANVKPADAAAETWALIRDSRNPEVFEDFATAYPGSDFTPGARVRAKQLRGEMAVNVEVPHGKTKVNPKDGLTYVWIEPGTFMMGCSQGDSECDDEATAHRVTLSKGYWMGQTDVTQEAYQQVTGKNPSGFKGAKLPVEQVSWTDSQNYCHAVGMRLPTEAEWEYAARAGNPASRYGDIDSIAWYNKNSGHTTHEVGKKQPNDWGLYDMLGNVWQWTADWYTDKYSGNYETDPKGPASGQFRALRGGSWDVYPAVVRVSVRPGLEPGVHVSNIGVRCAGN